MESVLSIMFSAENVRMLVMLVFGFSCFIWLKTSFEKKIDSVESSLNKRIGGVEDSLNKRIDGVEASIRDLKNNLNGTIEALTYALEKNGSLAREDKEYVDSRLAH
jgi:hypothetical protein